MRYVSRSEVRYSGADLTEVEKIDGLIDDTVSAFGSLNGHGSFDHPTSGADSKPRESIEVRTLLYFD